MEWQTVRDVFVAALEVDEDSREAVIARETIDHPDVAREVRRLLRLHQRAGGFLETDHGPAGDRDEQPLIATDELVADRFAVRKLLGRGGMGEVYEAYDRLLCEPVALKVMRSASGDPVSRAEFFRREVQLARRISHPGVCRVHDVALHRRRDGQPLLVLTMELLVGPTLAERLRRGRVPRPEAQSIITAIAAALQAAHARGIVHGDIKPENVILVARNDGSTRVVLTDFGLAKGLGGLAPPSSSSALIGTPAYMAPELFRGAAPSIASDLYAFALLTYQLLSAHDDLWRRTRVLAPNSAVASLPAGFKELAPHEQRVLSKAVSIQPKDRFSSPIEFVGALFPETGGHQRRIAILSIAALLVALVSVTAGPLLRSGRLPSAAPPNGGAPAMVLVTATLNHTGQPELDGVTEMLRAQLAQSPRLDVLGPDRVVRVLPEMRRDSSGNPDAATLRQVALRQGAQLVVFSSIALAGVGYRFDVRIERLGARPSIVEQDWQQQFVARGRDQLFEMVRRGSNWVRRTVGESNAELNEQDRLPTEITTASWDALRAFAKAQESYARGDSMTAVVYLQEALRFDPEFVSAHARLGDVLVAMRREREGYAAWQRAVTLADTRQLATREALRLRTQYLEDTSSLAEAELAARAYVLRYPADYEANLYLGSHIAQQGRAEEAIPWLENAARVKPLEPSGHVFLATRLIELERFEQAAAVADRLRESTQPEWATWIRALIGFARGDIETALGVLDELAGTSDRMWRSRFHTLRSAWLAEAGRLSEAERELTGGIAFDMANGLGDRAALKWLHVADLHLRANDRTGAIDALRSAMSSSSDTRALGIAGSQFARLGMVEDVEGIRDRLARFPDVPRVRVALRRLDAEVQIASGNPAFAAEMLDEVAGTVRFTEPKDFYAAALTAAGRHDDAVEVLAGWVEHPARFYAAPEPSAPAPWTTAIEQYVALLTRQGRVNDAAAWQGRLLAVRRQTSHR